MAMTKAEISRRYRQNHLEERRADSRWRTKKWRVENPEKYTEGQRKYSATHRQKKLEYAKQFRATWYEKNMIWLLSYLHIEVLACTRCGYNKYAGAIDFHHTDPSFKTYGRDILAHYIMSASFQKWFINTKGIFLCANCHREEHAKHEAFQQ